MKVFWNSIACVAVLTSGSVIAFAAGAVNSGRPVPYLQNDAASIEFIAGILEKETNASSREIDKFSRRLVMVLSPMSPAEQNEVWYGSSAPPADPPPPADPGPSDGEPSGSDGTPIPVNYPTGNSSAVNDVFADAVQAYWKMHAAAHRARTTSSDQVFSHDRDGWWDFSGDTTFPGDKTRAELEAELGSMSSQLESDLDSWIQSNGGSYPSPWPPELPDLDDPILDTEVTLPYLGP